MFYLRSWLDNFCIIFKYLLTESCDSLLSWPCVNFGRLSHQKIINKNAFCLYNVVFDKHFCDSKLPLVPSMRSANDSMQSLIKNYELNYIFLKFFSEKSTNKSKQYKILISNNYKLFVFHRNQFTTHHPMSRHRH